MPNNSNTGLCVFEVESVLRSNNNSILHSMYGREWGQAKNKNKNDNVETLEYIIGYVLLLSTSFTTYKTQKSLILD
jgi:hypothetical protein